MFDVNTLENIPTMPDKKEHNESSNSSAASDESKDPVSREQELKRKLAATRNMQMLAAHEELDELHEDTIDAFNMMPHALNTEMFDSDIFGDLDDLWRDIQSDGEKQASSFTLCAMESESHAAAARFRRRNFWTACGDVPTCQRVRLGLAKTNLPEDIGGFDRFL